MRAFFLLPAVLAIGCCCAGLCWAGLSGLHHRLMGAVWGCRSVAPEGGMFEGGFPCWACCTCPAARSMAVGLFGGLWRIASTPAPSCGAMCGGGGAGGLAFCGSEVWLMDQSGGWVRAEGMAGVKVRAISADGGCSASQSLARPRPLSKEVVQLEPADPDVTASEQPAPAAVVAGHRRRRQRHWLCGERLQRGVLLQRPELDYDSRALGPRRHRGHFSSSRCPGRCP